MTTKQRKKQPPIDNRPKAKKRDSKEISALHKLIYAACRWNPNRTIQGQEAALSNNELAHLRTETILKHISFTLLFRHRLNNLKNKLNEKFPKAKTTRH
jgi:hypothetical protein